MPQYLLRERVALLVARLRVEKGDDEPAEFVEPLHRKTEQFHEDRDRKARGDGGDEFAFAAPRHLAAQPVGPLGDAGFEWLDRLRFEEGAQHLPIGPVLGRSEEHTSELQSLMRTSYAVTALKNNNKITMILASIFM